MGGSFEIGRARSRGWKNFAQRWTRGVEALENWRIFMVVICASSTPRHKALDATSLILRLKILSRLVFGELKLTQI